MTNGSASPAPSDAELDAFARDLFAASEVGYLEALVDYAPPAPGHTTEGYRFIAA